MIFFPWSHDLESGHRKLQKKETSEIAYKNNWPEQLGKYPKATTQVGNKVMRTIAQDFWI